MKLTRQEREKLRYQSDPEFRKSLIKRVTKYQKKKRLREADKDEIVWKKFSIKIKNSLVPVEACRIGTIAVAINRSIQTLRIWEKSKFIPNCAFRFKGHRYYTKNQYDLFVKLWEKHKNDLNKFFAELNKHWRY